MDELTAWIETAEAGFAHLSPPHVSLYKSFVLGDQAGGRFLIRYYKQQDGGLVAAKVCFGPGAQGPPGHAHGGSIAAVLDETMSAAVWVAGRAVLAAELTVRFRKMLPLEAPCIAEAGVARARGRKVWAWGRLRGRGGELYADSEGLYIEIEPSRLGELPESVADLFLKK